VPLCAVNDGCGAPLASQTTGIMQIAVADGTKNRNECRPRVRADYECFSQGDLRG
jgi:hypothetical protein